MRTIKDHAVTESETLNIAVTDQPGAGGACHRYEVTGFDTAKNPSKRDGKGYEVSFSRLIILFQNGPIKEVGVNGITQEALLAIVLDRLRSFQAGPFPSPHNGSAVFHVQQALECLKERTRERIARAVEGTTAK